MRPLGAIGEKQEAQAQSKALCVVHAETRLKKCVEWGDWLEAGEKWKKAVQYRNWLGVGSICGGFITPWPAKLPLISAHATSQTIPQE